MLRSLLLAVALLAVSASAAHAGTITATVERDCAGDEEDPACYTMHAVKFTAAPGERNDVTVERLADRVVLRDVGAPPTAGAGCAAGAPGTVECAITLTPESGRDLQFMLTADLGDGDDRGDIGRLEGPVDNVFLQGGAGDDVLAGADVKPQSVSRSGGQGVWLDGAGGNDTLEGGAAGELVYGGAGTDTARGGAGDDFLDGDASSAALNSTVAADVLDGGAGRDEISYSDRRGPVTVDLADAGPDGQEGEGDTLTAIEDVRGGQGVNVLRGDDGPNRLVGSSVAAVADRLEGRGGDDVLDGGAGRRDVADGGAGNDRIKLEGGTRICGEGVDVLVGFDASIAPADCERVLLDDELRVDLAAVSLTSRRVVVRLKNEGVRRLRARLMVQARAGQRFVRRTLTFRPGQVRRVTFRLTRPSTRPRLRYIPDSPVPAMSVRLRRR